MTRNYDILEAKRGTLQTNSMEGNYFLMQLLISILQILHLGSDDKELFLCEV
jgi:hypothetical protein